ncbi:MAG: 5-formyltetrahydrofolate cyclo-ligase [Chloroflexi bacterium]|nr:5-formyltetrahydrofolate cyclo-ligase [Chloroflexota bacterium]|tara:strand:+ start:922 stop:1479 length:558 start_codon:yes stop_codon:yes gene_type:complete
MSSKENIRNEKRHERSLLSDAHIARLSHNFLSQWLKFSKELSYRSIGLYYPFDNEASTLEIMNYLHSKNKKVLLPVIKNESKKLSFAKYGIQSELSKNQFGIFEPKDKEFFDIKDIDIVLMPCVAFNHQLFRLGMGGGFYDRTFSKKTSTILIGIAYSFQLENKLFQEKHDIKMDYIITQKGVLR